MSRSEVRNERRNQILDAAERVFARNGFAESRMEQIVEEANVSKGSIYWYFKSKDEIIDASLARMFDRSLQDVMEQLKSDRPVVERIMTVARHATEQMRNARQLAGVELEAYAMAARNRSMRRRAGGYFDTYIDSFAKLIADGIERGELRSVDPRRTAISGVALFEGLTLLWVVNPDLDFENLLSHAAGLMLATLLPSDRRIPVQPAYKLKETRHSGPQTRRRSIDGARVGRTT
jgi:TetR/AcrR family transcriptional regulator, fatty acid metabolism regulator protein